MKKILLIIAILFPTNILAIEFTGKFIQGHYILGKTDPSSKIIIDKKKIKVSKNGFFVFSKRLLGTETIIVSRHR